ncbi:hypothetical protein [Labilibacter marinus]|uniref:hypothetical protein n=1 Tax=Labilibacter marinus TaxID=1477105 RepID=UPI00117B0732|nr:hypothetical protein [Labilibacter marinus]
MSAKEKNDIILPYLSRVCENRAFEKSPRNVRLLKFLVDQSLQGKDVNEYVIGLELFADNYDPDKNDSKVRVYMYNLRKKLYEYYHSDGKNDAIKFSIDKGQYNLRYEEKEKELLDDKGQGMAIFFNKHKNILLSLVLLLVLISALFIWVFKYSSEQKYCWSEFFVEEANNICVIADQVICWQPLGDRVDPRINEHINSEADFITYKQKHPEDSIRLANYSLYSKMAPFAIKDLNSWFIEHGSDFALRQESRFDLEELRNHNVVYIGQFKTMTTSKSVFLKDSKKFKVRYKPHGFIYQEGDLKKTYIPNNYPNIQTEYAMVSYMKLSSGKKGLYFVSNNDIGVMATVNKFTNKDWMVDFYTNLSSEDSYFNALFEVNGLQRTEISCELIHFEEINY